MPNASTALHPFPGYALVRLGEQYKNIQVQEGKYDSRTTGTLMELAVVQSSSDRLEIYEDACGKEVWFDQFSEGARVEQEGVLYAFVKIDNIQGYRNV